MTLAQAAAFAHRDTPRIFCIGRNYAKHIAELDSTLPGAECVIFMKPLASLVAPDEALMLPTDRGEIHHEAEVVIEIGRSGRDIHSDSARDHIAALGLGLDLTARDVQTELKSAGEPWERAKAFEQSAPLGPMTPLTDDINLDDLRFELAVDGQTRQAGHTANMMVGIAGLVAVVSRTWTLRPGDLIFTGTPEGVGPIAPGQQLRLSGPQFETASWAVGTA